MSEQVQWAGLADGVNNGTHPLYLMETQCVDASNVTFRNGFPTTRPGFALQPFTLPRSGQYQGAAFYDAESGPALVLAQNGEIYLIQLQGGEVQNISNIVGPQDSTIERMSFCQADRFMIIQDGRRQPIILDGVAARRADPTKPSKYSQSSNEDELPRRYFKGEIPPAYAMAYGQGRIALSPAGSNEIVFGDLKILGDPENILMFTETNYLNEGGSFKAPDHIGPITAMSFMAVADSANGIGPLLVQGKGGAQAFDIGVPRASWGSEAISTGVYKGPGPLGQRQVVPTERDTYWLAADGIRSIRQTRGNQANDDVVASLSQEIRLYIQGNHPEWMATGAGCMANQRMYFLTCPTGTGIFGGLLVADFAFETPARRLIKPCFNGIWTLSDPILDLAAVRHEGSMRPLVVCERDGVLRFWVEEAGSIEDSTGPISSFIITRSMKPSGPLIADRLFSGGLLAVDDVTPGTAIEASLRADSSENWTEPSPLLTVAPAAGAPPCTSARTSARNLRIPMPPTGLNGMHFQVSVRWTGHASIISGLLDIDTAQATSVGCAKVAPLPLTRPHPTPYKVT